MLSRPASRVARTPATLLRRAALCFVALSPWPLCALEPPPSSLHGDAALLQGWRVVPVNGSKPLTDYEWLNTDTGPVLRALARSSASFLLRDAPVDLARTPVLSWRWRVDAWPVGAHNAVGSREDSAARLVLMFSGDPSRLPWSDRVTLRLASSLSGHEMPYATLMYIVSDSAPVGTRLANPHTGRVQMIVASNPSDVAHRWLSVSRQVAKDFHEAFGEDPGPLLAWGVMTDSDNTHSEAQASYRDMRFGPAPLAP